jgi:retron-type reverse transcriptase
MSTVIDVDLSRYFDTIRHSVLLDKIAKRVHDPQVLHLVKQIIKAGGEIGIPQGGPFSPLAANIYLNEVDWAFDAIRRKTAQGPYEAVNYHRFADDIVICRTSSVLPYQRQSEFPTDVTSSSSPFLA